MKAFSNYFSGHFKSFYGLNELKQTTLNTALTKEKLPDDCSPGLAKVSLELLKHSPRALYLTPAFVDVAGYPKVFIPV